MSAHPITSLLNKYKEMKVTLILTSIVCIMAIAAYYYFDSVDKYPTACNANFVMRNENENNLTAYMVIKISRTNDKFLTQILGTLHHNGIETNISRSIYATAHNTCCYLHLVTKKINISSVDNTSDEYLRLLFPPYYLRIEESANIYIYPQKDGDFVFSNGTHVYFICNIPQS